MTPLRAPLLLLCALLPAAPAAAGAARDAVGIARADPAAGARAVPSDQIAPASAHARDLARGAVLALLLLALLLVLRKHRGLARARATAPDLLWKDSA